MVDQLVRTYRGTKHQKIIQSLLNKLKSREYIKDYKFHPKTQRIGYKGFKSQFYVPFSIEFSDGEKWIIQSTTTYPRERINGYQWQAEHIKKIDKSVKKALVIYSDSIKEKELKSCINYNDDIKNKRIISELDGIVSFADLYMMIEEKWLQNKSSGKKKALQGTAFEKWLIDILNDETNVEIWNGQGDEDLGFNYPLFKKILIGLGVSPTELIQKIDATDNIPNLPRSHGKKRGGKPKTDILIILSSQSKLYYFTISAKRTSSKWVTIHEYRADDYINVLKITEPELREAIYELERIGSPTQISGHYQDILRNQLPKYYSALAKWAYAGIGGMGTDQQKANYFVIYKNRTKELEIYDLEHYINKILSEVKGQFGSPFKFTYASGKRGKNIQLKGKVI